MIVFSEEDALEVMNLIHARGVGTVVLSSTELASPHRLGEFSHPGTAGLTRQFLNFILKRLDQGHLHSKLKVPALTCPGRESNPGLHGGRRAL